MVDVLYLKNGSIIKGTITEMVPNQTIKIKMADGSLFVFKMEEVEKFVKEEKPSIKAAVNKPKPEPPKETRDTSLYIPKKTGFYFNFQVGGGFVISPTQTAVAITPTLGYQFSPYFKFGIGFGYISEKYYKYSSEISYSGNLNIVPIFVDAKFLFTKKKVTPMLNVDFGLAYNASSSSPDDMYRTNSVYFDFGSGFLFNIHKSLNVNVSADLVYVGNKIYSSITNEVFSISPLILVKIGIGI
jgi:hypothetical protein